jgi:hypothetical protein
MRYAPWLNGKISHLGSDSFHRGECGLAACPDGFALFGLEPGQEKARLAEFGRFVEESRRRRGLGKPKTLDFLRFTCVCPRSRSGRLRMKRETARKKLRLKLSAMSFWAGRNRSLRLKELYFRAGSKLRGRCRHYGTVGNCRQIGGSAK